MNISTFLQENKFKVKNIIFYTIVFCTLFSCTDPTLSDRINDLMSEHDSLEVKMTDVFPFEWDTLYVFLPFRYNRRQYQYAQDIERRIVLVKDGKVLHKEAEISGERTYGVEFITEDFFFIPENSTFMAVKVKRSRSTFIRLKPLGSHKELKNNNYWY